MAAAVLPAPAPRTGLLVVQPLRRKHCAGCRSGPLPMLVMEDAAPRCLDCADLGHLVFLPRGDTALTRRSREESGLSAVVVRFNRRKGRYERQGVLVEETALVRAEERCLADAEARRRRTGTRGFGRRRTSASRRRSRRRSCGCFPAARESGRAGSPCTPHCGAVAGWGRSAAGRALSEGAVVSAVVASVRHLDTPYDRLLMIGVPRPEARRRIASDVEALLRTWREGQEGLTAQT
ncbi:hypothetical protein QF030_002497 [Streptomyces rishiriensis]|uniref:DUF2293 domain-containing protein n=1 Tax=Streptomyces rishiriensis TaxID=68264 RepID=A0ABU0NMH1_STRRH|nr:hypothetical protein [Streptomyces rishiriensis]